MMVSRACAADTAPAQPEDHRHQRADRADDEQDDPDRMNVETVAAHMHRESHYGADCDQEKTDSDTPTAETTIVTAKKIADGSTYERVPVCIGLTKKLVATVCAPRKNSGVPYYLFCAECSAVSNEFERGWRGFLTDDEFEPAEVAILRPECAEREFGPRQFRIRAEDD